MRQNDNTESSMGIKRDEEGCCNETGPFVIITLKKRHGKEIIQKDEEREKMRIAQQQLGWI